MIILKVKARTIKDSRGADTISVSVNNCDWASSPNGKSTGEYETPSYYKSLKFCVGFLNDFNEKIEINKFEDLFYIEKAICKKLKLKNIKQFGANALYAFQSAILKALASKSKKELFEIVNPKINYEKFKIPFPVGNVVGGGLHSSAIKIHPNFQEFLVIPKSEKFFDNLRAMNYIYSILKNKLNTSRVNDEGAFLVYLDNNEVLDILNKCRFEAEKKFGFSIDIGIDVASSVFYKNGRYNYSDKKIDSESQIKLMQSTVLNNEIFYLEDPFEEHDFKSFAELQKKIGKNCLIVGDDLIATQYNRAVGAIRTKSVNAMIIKPNQNGSLLELKKIFDLCKKNGIKTILSHRSGETIDDALADYAVGFGVDYIKCGVATKWREVKLNRLKKIESMMRIQY